MKRHAVKQISAHRQMAIGEIRRFGVSVMVSVGYGPEVNRIDPQPVNALDQIADIFLLPDWVGVIDRVEIDRDNTGERLFLPDILRLLPQILHEFANLVGEKPHNAADPIERKDRKS